MSIGLNGIRRRRTEWVAGVGVIWILWMWRGRRGVVYRSGWRLRVDSLHLRDQDDSNVLMAVV